MAQYQIIDGKRVQIGGTGFKTKPSHDPKPKEPAKKQKSPNKEPVNHA